MKRKLQLIFLFWVFLLPSAAPAAENISPENEMERLAREYRVCRDKAHAAFNDRKPLPVYFQLIGEIESLQEELEALGIVLANLEENQLLGMGSLAARKDQGGPEGFSGVAVMGDRLIFEVERSGVWSNAYDVEWLLNGTSYAKMPASHPASSRYVVDFSDIYDPGAYEVSVQAVHKKTGRIEAVKKMAFNLKKADAVKEESKPDEADGIKNHKTLTPERTAHPAAQKLPVNVPAAKTTEKNSHCQNLFSKVIENRKAQESVSRQMKTLHEIILQNFQDRLRTLNARVEQANRKIQAGERSVALQSEIRGIKTEQSVLKEFQNAHNRYSGQPCDVQYPALAQTAFGLRIKNDIGQAVTYCNALYAHGETHKQLMSRLSESGCIDEKGGLLFDPRAAAGEKEPPFSQKREQAPEASPAGQKNYYAVPYYQPKSPWQCIACKVIGAGDGFSGLAKRIKEQKPSGTENYNAWGPWDGHTAQNFCRCVQGKPVSYLQDAETTGHSEDFPKFLDGCK